jgi:hypothetical protein
MSDDQAREDEVLRILLRTPPKPHPKPNESGEPRRRGRPLGGGKEHY